MAPEAPSTIYKGLEIPVATPTFNGGKALKENFKQLADSREANEADIASNAGAAASAQSDATQGIADAAAALGVAANAQNDANTAQGTANNALAVGTTAQSDATQALADASAAQSDATQALAGAAPVLETITKDNEGDTQPDTFRFTVQVKDIQGNNWGKRAKLFVYISDAAFGDPATITTLTAATGTDIPITLAQSIMVITDATGKVLIDAEWTGVGTRHLVVALDNEVQNISATWA